jgi:hypothetical protein
MLGRAKVCEGGDHKKINQNNFFQHKAIAKNMKLQP